MRMVEAIDPEGVQHRRNRRLKRRSYCCKVRLISCISMPYNNYTELVCFILGSQ